MGSALSYFHSSIEPFMFMPPFLNYNQRSRVLSDESVSEHIVKDPYTQRKIAFLQYEPQILVNGKVVLIFSHGNASDIYSYYSYGKKLSDMLGIRCIFYDYPGYGLSEGGTTTMNCVETLSFVVKIFVDSGYIPFLVGQSIGTGIVCEYANQNRWSLPLVLISPYKSIIKVATESCNSFTEYIDVYPTITYVANMLCPIKIIHGRDDDVIPFDHGMQIYNNIQNKRLDPCWLDNIGHNDILGAIPFDEFRECIDLI